MKREQIKDFKEIVLPFFKNYLMKVNYENRGKSDAEVFEKDFNEIIELANKALAQEPISDKYEYHIDHTDCIWYGNDSGCPVTCSQYRDGWNDAMNYIFKNGDGYRPYRRGEEDGRNNL